MRALVTGATGFIGSTLITHLENFGYSVRILSRENNLDYDTIVCDLNSGNIPEAAFNSVDIVFHLAGYTHDLKSNEKNKKDYYDVNVKGTVSLIKAASRENVKKFIFVSSVKAGGISGNGSCMTEMDQNIPEGDYGITKREAEIKILKIGRISNIHVSIVRPALVYGHKMKGNLAVMLRGVENGWFPPLPRMHNKRSMIHVRDLVSVILLLAEHDCTNKQIYIATDGIKYTSRDIYKAMRRTTGKDIPIWSLPKIVFYFIAKIGDVVKFIPFDSYKYGKLFGSECYLSNKLKNLGFEPKYNFYSYLDKKNRGGQ